MPVKTRIVEDRNTDALLAKMPIELREKHLVKAVRAQGRVVAKAAAKKAPKPGYPGDKPDKTPLNKTIRTVVRRYGNVVMSITGPARPDGAHGHLVEFGHMKVLWGRRTGEVVEGKEFMRPAADETQPEQERAGIDALKKALPELAS